MTTPNCKVCHKPLSKHKAGRELDARIGELLGLEQIQFMQGGVLNGWHYYHPTMAYQILPHYSTDMNDAMTAIEQLPKHIEVNIFCRGNMRVVSIEKVKCGGREYWEGTAMKKQTALAITRALLAYYAYLTEAKGK